MSPADPLQPAPGPYSSASPPGRVAVVGGGIAGLACAYFLHQRGAEVTLFEASDTFGGLGATFDYQGHPLERFYHCLVPSDRDLLGLLDSLGIADLVYWKETSFGIHARGRIYPLNTPSDLLRFDALPFIDRLRLALTGLYARLASARGLDEVTCESWLRRLSGDRAFETFWRPMLEAKFGERHGQIPALWFWTRLNREKGGAVERKGYIHGGYRLIADNLVAALTAGGHRLHLRAPIEAIGRDPMGRPRLRPAGADWQSFDRLVLTAPLSILRQAAAAGGAPDLLGGEDVDMVAVLNVVLILRRAQTRHYWIAVTDPKIPFQGIVETTNLIDPADLSGLHVVHLLRYLHRSDPWFGRPDAEVVGACLDGLRAVLPDTPASDVVDRFVFRTPFVEPVYTTGYLERRPAMEPVPGRIYLATSTQVYPQITSWNGSVGLARRLVDRMLGGVPS